MEKFFPKKGSSRPGGEQFDRSERVSARLSPRRDLYFTHTNDVFWQRTLSKHPDFSDILRTVFKKPQISFEMQGVVKELLNWKTPLHPFGDHSQTDHIYQQRLHKITELVAAVHPETGQLMKIHNIEFIPHAQLSTQAQEVDGKLQIAISPNYSLEETMLRIVDITKQIDTYGFTIYPPNTETALEAEKRVSIMSAVIEAKQEIRLTVAAQEKHSPWSVLLSRNPHDHTYYTAFLNELARRFETGEINRDTLKEQLMQLGREAGTGALLGGLGDKLYMSALPGRLEAELRKAKELELEQNLRPLEVGEKGFDTMIEHGVIWVILGEGEDITKLHARFMPRQSPKNLDMVAHTMGALGDNVRAAGEAEIIPVPGKPRTYVLGMLNRHTGHYRVDEQSLYTALATIQHAFEKAGLELIIHRDAIHSEGDMLALHQRPPLDRAEILSQLRLN